MTAEMLEKRSHLKDLSGDAAVMVEMGIVTNVNEGIKLLYAKEGHNELKTFNQWLNDGYHVRKGEKALLLWSKPLYVLKNEPKPEHGASFFPVVNLFSNLQVEPIQTK